MASQVEINKAVVARYFNELMNEGKYEVALEIASDDFLFHITTLPDPIPSPQGLMGFAQTLRGGFPDAKFTVVSEVAEGDKVLSRWTLTSTHNGEFLGIPATGRPMNDHGNDIFHLRDGKIVEMWVNEDSLGLMQQLGVIPPPPRASAEANKAVVRRYFDEIMNQANMKTIDEIIAPNFFFTIPTHAPAHGPDGFKRVVTMLHTAFPDLHFAINDEFGDGDSVAIRWTATGTHKGEFLGAPPSGKSFTIQGIGTYRVEHGQLVENLVNEDSLNLLLQIGLIPPLQVGAH